MPTPFANLTSTKPPEAITRTLCRTALSMLTGGWRRTAFWLSRARQRRNLSELDERLLDDVGIDPRSARREAEKRFWQD